MTALHDIELEEPATAPLGGYTTFIAVGRNGDLYVADMTAQRVVVFDSNGSVIRTVGTQGDGPGEFQLPAAIGVDPEGRLFVNDVAHRRLSLFAADSDSLLFEATLPFDQIGVGVAGYADTLVFVLQGGAKVFARWDRTVDSFTVFGSREQQEPGALSVQMSYGVPGIAGFGEGFVVWRPAAAGVELFTGEGALKRTVRVPASRRKGEPLGLVQSQRAVWRDHKDSVIGSLAVGISRFRGGGYVLASLDEDGEIQPDGTVRYGHYRLFVSLLSADLSRACVDAPVPLSSDVPPVPVLIGDTIQILVRQVLPTNAIRTTLKRFRISASSCTWHATEVLEEVE